MSRAHHTHVGSRFFTIQGTTYPQRVTMSQTFTSPPPDVPDAVLSSPRPHVLLVTLNRPAQLNALRREMHRHLDGVWAWFEAEPSLRCAVLTGRGRAFCAGADLKEWNGQHDGARADAPKEDKWTGSGFGGLSNRRGRKPIFAAVNGLCLGGGMEMVLNADMVLASGAAKFGLPEVGKGVVAVAGALPRLTRIVGRMRASEMALTGRMFDAKTMADWGVVNRVVVDGDVVEETLRWAAEVAGNSPDSVMVTREGILGGWDAEDPRQSTARVENGIYARMDGGENMREGTLSFVEKRKPVWKDSKL